MLVIPLETTVVQLQIKSRTIQKHKAKDTLACHVVDLLKQLINKDMARHLECAFVTMCRHVVYSEIDTQF